MNTGVSNPLAGIDFNAAGTTQLFPLGSLVQGQDGILYRYIKAAGNLTANLMYHILQNFTVATAVTSTTAAADATEGTYVCFPHQAVTSGDYAWVPVGGIGVTVKGAASCAKDVALCTSATAGVVDDTAATHYKVAGGVYLDVAIGAGGAATTTASIIGPAFLVTTVGA